MKDNDIPFKTGPLAGMTHKQIMKQAKKDDLKFKNKKDPFIESEKKYGSKSKMFKDSMKKLKKLTESKNKK